MSTRFLEPPALARAQPEAWRPAPAVVSVSVSRWVWEEEREEEWEQDPWQVVVVPRNAGRSPPGSRPAGCTPGIVPGTCIRSVVGFKGAGRATRAEYAVHAGFVMAAGYLS